MGTLIQGLKSERCYTDYWHTVQWWLTHWGSDKMAGMFQTTFSNAFSWMKMFQLRFIVPKGPINNIPALIQIMAWCRPGDKPLFEPMMVSLPTHICVIQPQWVKKALYLPFLLDHRWKSGRPSSVPSTRHWHQHDHTLSLPVWLGLTGCCFNGK